MADLILARWEWRWIAKLLSIGKLGENAGCGEKIVLPKTHFTALYECY
jgi:hypothetical protein